MNNPYTSLNDCREGFNGNLIVELGGMQITRDQLDSVKRANDCKTDQDAVDHLIWVAERAFSQELDFSENFEVVLEKLEKGEAYP